MKYSTKSLLLLAALNPLAVYADLELDDDISPACLGICRPVYQLSQTCDVDSNLVRDRLTEDYLTLQCYCINPSFDVRGITALCASCIQQNPTFDDRFDDDGDGDDDRFEDDRFDDDRWQGQDDLRGMLLCLLPFVSPTSIQQPTHQGRQTCLCTTVLTYHPSKYLDISEIMFRCGFQSSVYNAVAQSTAADRIVVQATRPTNAAQLTTYITGGVPIGQPTGFPGVPGVPGVPGFPTTVPPGGFPGGVTPTPFTSLRTTTYTTNFGQGLTTGTATIRATAAVTQGFSTSGASGRADGAAVVGWKAVLGYTVGVAAVAAWFF